MGKPAKPFTLTLTQEEADHILRPAGGGGHQGFQKELRAQLKGGLTVTLDDEGLGKLVRHMTQYKSGGFQGRLRKAFKRALLAQLEKK